MKKNEHRYSASKVISFAALLAMQTLPSSLHAQAANTEKQATQAARASKFDIFIKFKGEIADNMHLVAACPDACVFENSAGELFSVDAATGDMKPVSKSDYGNMKNAEMKNGKITFPPNNISSASSKSSQPIYKITIKENMRVMGVDKDKHVIMQNAAGENIYLDCSTGDMVRCATGKHFASATISK